MKICKKDDSILNQGPDFWQGTVVKIQIMLDFLVTKDDHFEINYFFNT